MHEVLRRSLTTTETDARRLRRKNAKVWLGIEHSEREAAKKAAGEAKAARLTKEHNRVARRFTGFMSSSLYDSGMMSTNNDNAPPTADAYVEENDRHSRDRKGLGPDVEMVKSDAPPFISSIYLV